MAYYWLIGWPQLRISGHADATHSSPPRDEWSALTSVTHRDDAVNSSPQKPPASYTRVSDFGPHTDLIFRARLIREGDLYASIYGNLRVCAVLVLATITHPRLGQKVATGHWQSSQHCRVATTCWYCKPLTSPFGIHWYNNAVGRRLVVSFCGQSASSMWFFHTTCLWPAAPIMDTAELLPDRPETSTERKTRTV